MNTTSDEHDRHLHRDFNLTLQLEAVRAWLRHVE
jgi:hypothetical protein